MQPGMKGMKYKKLNEEVLYTTEAVTRLGAADMAALAGMAAETSRHRVRLCTHESADSALHEMFIVHRRDAYVRPHMHRGRDESIHILAGDVDIVLFDQDGTVLELLEMSDYGSGRPFYCRIPKGTMHMLIIRSDVLVFCEATLGPFNRDDAVFASWAPKEGEDRVWDFVAKMGRKARGAA